MATYNADMVSTSKPAKHGLETVCVVGTYTVGANLAQNDIIHMVKIPAGAVVTEVVAATSAALGQTCTAEFGDGDDTDRYISSANFGNNAATVARLSNAAGAGFVETAEDTLDMKVTAIGTPTTGAVIKVAVFYYIP